MQAKRAGGPRHRDRTADAIAGQRSEIDRSTHAGRSALATVPASGSVLVLERGVPLEAVPFALAAATIVEPFAPGDVDELEVGPRLAGTDVALVAREASRSATARAVELLERRGAGDVTVHRLEPCGRGRCA